MIEESNIPMAESEIKKEVPSNWKEAFAVLASTRGAILKIEGKKAVSNVITKLVLVVVAVVGLLFGWGILMFGLVGLISAYSPMNWWQASFSVGGGHVLITIVLLLIVKMMGSELFPVTRKEFKKDSEWLNQLKG